MLAQCECVGSGGKVKNLPALVCVMLTRAQLPTLILKPRRRLLLFSSPSETAVRRDEIKVTKSFSVLTSACPPSAPFDSCLTHVAVLTVKKHKYKSQSEAPHPGCRHCSRHSTFGEEETCLHSSKLNLCVYWYNEMIFAGSTSQADVQTKSD